MLSVYACSRIFPSREKLIEGALELASTIASKSPVAVQGTKVSMVYSRDHTVQEGLDHVVSVCVCVHVSLCACVCVCMCACTAVQDTKVRGGWGGGIFQQKKNVKITAEFC